MPSMIKKLIFFAVGLLAIWTASAANKCAERSFGHGATVCVCNATYCDDISPIAKTAKGILTRYVSSQAGERLTKLTELHFSKDAPTNGAPVITVSVDHAKKYQKITGFGGAFTDSTGLNIAKLPKEMQSRLVKDYFAPDGIEYTVGRIPIGGSDFSTRAYSLDDHSGDEPLAKFALEPEDLNYKIPYIQMAQQVSTHKIRLFGSPWSPPAWMKTNNNVNRGQIIGKPGGTYFKIFAKYFVRFIQEYEKHNVSIWGLTVENEPTSGGNWNTLMINASFERDFIRLDLGPELHAHGYTNDKLKLMMYDDQIPQLHTWADTVLGDKEAAKYVSGIAFHWYQNSKANWNDLDAVQQKYPEQFLLATEACIEGSVSLGNWGSVNRYAEDIIKDLNHHTTGWTDWNLVLDEHGGPNWVKNFVDAPIIVNGTAHEYYKQPFFYAMGHFSKFLVPDSVKIHQDVVTHDAGNILVTVFQRPDGATVLIILNKNAHDSLLQIHDPTEGYVDVSVKAHSIESIVWY